MYLVHFHAIRQICKEEKVVLYGSAYSKKKFYVHTKKDRLSQDWNSNKIHFAFFRDNEKNLIPAYALRILETNAEKNWNQLLLFIEL